MPGASLELDMQVAQRILCFVLKQVCMVEVALGNGIVYVARTPPRLGWACRLPSELEHATFLVAPMYGSRVHCKLHSVARA